MCCRELYPSLCCKNVLTVHKHWLNMETNESVEPSRREERKAAEFLSKEIRSWKKKNKKTPYGIQVPPFHLQRAHSQHFMWPEGFPGWCTAAYWSPESQTALVSAGRLLVGFINKPGLVRDTDGCWSEHRIFSHLISYKKRKCLEISLHISHLSSPSLFITHFPCQMLLHLS